MYHVIYSNLHLVLTQPAVKPRLYTANVTDKQYCSIVFFSFVKLLLYKDLQTMCCLGSIHTPLGTCCVPVVSVKKQWHKRRTLALFGSGSNSDFKFSSNPSSQEQLFCTNPYSQVFGCSYMTGNIYRLKTLIQMTIMLYVVYSSQTDTSVHTVRIQKVKD